MNSGHVDARCYQIVPTHYTRLAEGLSAQSGAAAQFGTHEWIGESWGGSLVNVRHVDFQGRRCLRVNVGAGSNGWGVIRTKRFPLENWEAPNTALKADVYILDKADIRLKLQAHGEKFDPLLTFVLSPTLASNRWETVTWSLPEPTDLRSLGSISIVIEGLRSSAVELYIDNLRLIKASGGERPWDQMDDGRLWFYFGNWDNWSSVKTGDFPGIEPVS